MIALARDIFAGVAGIIRLLRFRDDWRDCFDVSASGLARSFGALIFAAPLAFFFYAGFDRLRLALDAPVEPVPLYQDAILFALPWLTFPLIAAACVRAVAKPDAFAPWVVVHNYAVLTLYLVVSIFIALFLTGFLSAGMAALVLGPLYQIFRLGVHWRVATGATGLPPSLTAGMAMTHILFDLVILTAIGRWLFAVQPAA